MIQNWISRCFSSKWGEKSIVYYAPGGVEAWSPEDYGMLKGGSQLAVYHNAKEWNKLGYQVTIYGQLLKEGIYDGVRYLKFSRFNRFDQFNILIIWRGYNFDLLKFPLKARRIVADLHDFFEPKYMHVKGVEKIDSFVFHSHYARSKVSGLADEKVAVIPNGYLFEYSKLAGTVKEPFRLIYAGQYFRGLELMLQFGWPLIKGAVPQAELHIYGGWPEMGLSKLGPGTRWRNRMMELMAQPGIFHHGQVDRERLIKERAMSAIHYYGCTFEEFDCITVRESMAVGCVPVTTDFAALYDKPYCVKISGDPLLRQTQESVALKVAELLKDQNRLDEIRKEFLELVKDETWENLAKEWVKCF